MNQFISIDTPVYTVGIVDFLLVNVVNLGDYHYWKEANLTNIIDNVALMGKVSYKYLEVDALSPTLDINVDLSNVNLYLSDFLALSSVEILFGMQEAYNNHAENVVGDSELEETKIDVPMDKHEEQKVEEEEEQTAEYEIIEPEEKETPVSHDKIKLWEKQINQRVSCKFEGFNVTLSERDRKINQDTDIIFMCVQTIKFSLEMTNKGMNIATGIKRFYVQDSNLIRENKSGEIKNPMPDVFGMLVSNPLLERALLKETDDTSRNTEDIKSLAKGEKIKNTLYQLVVNVHNSSTDLDIDFVFNNFRVVANEKTTERLVKFGFQVINALDTKDNQLEKLKEEYIKYSTSEASEAVGPLKSDFQFVNAEQEIGIFESLKKARENYLIKEKGVKKIKLEKLQEKKKMNVYGTVNNIEIWIPINWTPHEAKVMSFAFSSHFKHFSFSHKDYYINNLTNLIFRVDSITDITDTKATLKSVTVKIEQINLNEFEEGKTETVLIKSLKEGTVISTPLHCHRVEFGFEKESKPQQREADSTLSLSVQPIGLELGFIEINEFKTVYFRIMEIINSLTEQNKDIINKIQEDYHQVQQKVKFSYFLIH